MVTRIPARTPAPAPLGSDVLALLERCLRDGPGALDPAASGLLRERAAQLLAALDPAALDPTALDPAALVPAALVTAGLDPAAGAAA
ncbi:MULTISPECIES: hypothetical protein [unclassified Blastococcus]